MLRKNGEQGFSIIELVGVMTLIGIMSAISIFYLNTNKKLLAAEEQAIRLSDILQEARQKAFTQKQVMRVEINNTTRKIRIIEEKDPGMATDDLVVREMDFYGLDKIRFETNPTNVTSVPADTSPVPKAVFQSSMHPLSLGNSVATIRFLRNGLVANAGTVDAFGTGATVGGVTVYVWKPTTISANTGDVVKAITISGGSGNIRMWEYRFPSNNWFDVRGIN